MVYPSFIIILAIPLCGDGDFFLKKKNMNKETYAYD